LTAKHLAPSTATRLRSRLATVGAVAIGGAAGTLLRFWVVHNWPESQREFPFPILAVNLIGCGALGLLHGLDAKGAIASHRLRAGVGAGLLGGLTTFSTFALGDVQLLQANERVGAIVYLLFSVPVGIVCAWVGKTLVYRTVRPAVVPAGDRQGGGRGEGPLPIGRRALPQEHVVTEEEVEEL